MKRIFFLSLFVILTIRTFAQDASKNITNNKLGSDDKLMLYIKRHLSSGFIEKECMLFAAFYINKNGSLDSLNVLNNADKEVAPDLLENLKKAGLDSIWNAGKDRTVLLPIFFIPQNAISPARVSISFNDIEALSKFLPQKNILLQPVIVNISPVRY